MSRASFLALPAAAIVVAGLAGCSTGSDPAPSGGDTSFPESAITLIVPFPAGSGPDAAARVIATEMENDLDVSIVVENVEGGSSTIGLFEAASAANDGYTLVYAAATGVSIQSRIIDTPFGGLETLTPIAQTSVTANVMVASPNSGIATIDDFIEAAEDRPGELTVGLGNRASGQDIQVALLEEAADIDVKPVYFDAGQMILPAVNGTVDVSVVQFAPVVQYVEKGDLQYVGAFTAPEGVDVELFEDAGYATDRWVGWEGFFGPADMDEAVLQVISDAVERATQSDAYLAYMEKTYGIPAFIGWEEFADVAAQVDEDAPKLIDEMGLKK